MNNNLLLKTFGKLFTKKKLKLSKFEKNVFSKYVYIFWIFTGILLFYHAIPRSVSLTIPNVFIIFHSKYDTTMKTAFERFHYVYCLDDRRVGNSLGQVLIVKIL